RAEEPADGNRQHFAQLEQPGGANAVLAHLVFLQLLKAQADPPRQLLLADCQQSPSLAQSPTNQQVEIIRLACLLRRSHEIAPNRLDRLHGPSPSRLNARFRWVPRHQRSLRLSHNYSPDRARLANMALPYPQGEIGSRIVDFSTHGSHP